MGVVWVCQWPTPEGKRAQFHIETLHKRLEILGAVKAGNFYVDCETYNSSPAIASQRVNVLHNTEQPATCFAALDSGLCLVADNLFDMLMQKLLGIYSPKKSAKIESKGQRFEVADFLVKVGSVSVGPSFKGILVEVEYCPCVVPSLCAELMKEFIQGFMGNCVQGPPQYLSNKLNEVYNATDTIHQYLDHFNTFKKSTVQQ